MGTRVAYSKKFLSSKHEEAEEEEEEEEKEPNGSPKTRFGRHAMPQFDQHFLCASPKATVLVNVSIRLTGSFSLEELNRPEKVTKHPYRPKVQPFRWNDLTHTRINIYS